MKFAANLTHLWPELPYLDRFEAAAAAGFEAVEILFPYDLAAKETQQALLANGLELVLINAPPPNYTGGTRGFAAVPGGDARFRHDMKRVFRYVEVLRPSFVHVMTGEAEGDAAHQTLLENLRWATKEAPAGLTLTLEPLNGVSMPGYFLNDYKLAAEILSEIESPNLKLQYDSFHAQMIHGDARAVFIEHLDRIAHIQIGDAPNRSAPGTGIIDFDALFAEIAASGYGGWISGEYQPGTATEKTLNWMKLK